MGGQWAAGTTYVEFEDVKVPVENLIGKEGEGFKIIMTNFNHVGVRPWAVPVQAPRVKRRCGPAEYSSSTRNDSTSALERTASLEACSGTRWRTLTSVRRSKASSLTSESSATSSATWRDTSRVNRLGSRASSTSWSTSAKLTETDSWEARLP